LPFKQYLVHGKRTGDRINLFAREATNTAYHAVVALRQADGWRLDYLDGQAGKVCLDSDESECLALMYGMYYKLRI
jgi:hypothetical protein